MKQLSLRARAYMTPLFVLLVTITVLMTGAPEAWAYEQYSISKDATNCRACHGNYRSSPYTSLVDGVNWGDDLHDVHRNGMLSGDCDACHKGSKFPVILDSSDGGVDLLPISCVGCHGREQDMGHDSISMGRGAGLRRHHWTAGVTGCADCHSDADPANDTVDWPGPVGENVLPNYYEFPGANHPNIPTDACNANGLESVFSGTDFGLDNDGDGIYDTADDNCSVANVPPVADANGPYTGTVGLAVSFDGSGSFDSDGTIVAYDWDFGDGSSGTGVSPSHTYASDATFAVTLTVTDDAGDSDSTSTTASIDPIPNVPPTADAGGPYTGTVGSAVSFDGSGSSDSDGTIDSYAWDFGDGSSGTGVSASHTYASDATFAVTLTVTDNDGESDTDSTSATIVTDNLPPTTVDIDEAKWESGDDRLVVKGVKANQGETVIISNANTGETIGTTRVPNGGEWKFEKELGQSPCRVRATIGNQFDEKDVNNAPSNCDDTGPPPSTVEIKETKWESGDDRLVVKGIGASPEQMLIITNADTGEEIGSTRAKSSGEWQFERELDRSPCRVRATTDDQFDEKDVRDAPANCDDGTDPPPSTVIIKDARWRSGESELEVWGDMANPGETVIISNADNGEPIGTTLVKGDGKWRFREEIDLSPCRVRTTIDNQFDEEDVRDAPASCSR
jgi:PKD repeat protein